MCGFFGLIDLNQYLDLEKAKDSTKTLQHRGPDFQGTWTNNATCFLGHNRLSIIDLSSEANQPFLASDQEVAIVFNGEIYNYQVLKDELSLPAKTDSDTEVIVEGYLREGTEFFSRLRGIYAFAIFDNREEPKVVVARDPSGVKPLYYSHQGNRFVFGSEKKSILCYVGSGTINEPVIQAYLHLGFCPEPETAYREISTAKPGWVYTFCRGGLTKRSFFHFKFDSNSLSIEENMEKVQSLLGQAMQRNLVADVECTLALSGGIDSSLLYYFGKAQKDDLLALTVSFTKESKYDESAISSEYTKYLNGKHRILEIESGLDLEQLNLLLDHFDQPFADSSLIPVYFLTKSSRSISKVLIGGDGGDELFNGYPAVPLLDNFLGSPMIQNLWSMLYPLKFLLPGEKRRKVDRANQLIGKSVQEAHFLATCWFPPGIKFNNQPIFLASTREGLNYYSDSYLEEKPETVRDEIVFSFFRKTLLGDFLRKTDMMSMINGVELRVPFLDEDLTSYAFSIPFHQKSNSRTPKKFLRSMHSKIYGGLGSNLPKKGFTIPLDTYLSLSEKQEINNTILKKGNYVSQWVSRKFLEFLCQEFLNYRTARAISRDAVSQRILTLYSLERWIQIRGF